MVCGAWEVAEMFDRFHAYRIAGLIEQDGRYDPLVVTDRYWLDTCEGRYPSVPCITLGGPVSNAFSARLKTAYNLGKFDFGVKDTGERLVGYLWGDDVRSTFEAAYRFVREGHLQTMLNRR